MRRSVSKQNKLQARRQDKALGSGFVRGTPFATLATKMSQRVSLERVVYTNTSFSSSGVGVINDVYILRDPTIAAGWSDLADVWQQYRVVATKIQFRPYNRYSKTTTVTRALVGVVDNVSSAAIPNFTTAMNNPSVQYLSLDDPWTMEWRLRKDDPAANIWTDAGGSPGSVECFKFYGDGLSLSTAYGMVVIEFMVELRGRD